MFWSQITIKHKENQCFRAQNQENTRKIVFSERSPPTTNFWNNFLKNSMNYFLRAIPTHQVCSWSFVISLQIETLLVFPITLIRFVIVFSSLFGDSKNIDVLLSFFMVSKHISWSLSFLGTNPKNVNLSVGSPDITAALITDEGPGIKAVSYTHLRAHET